MANIITGCRVLFSLLLLFVPAFSPRFFILYLICGVTDMVDGAVARKTNTVSELGSRLDSLADLLFTAVCLVKLLPAVELPPWLWLWIAVITGIKAVNLLFGFLLQGKFPAEHTIMNKATGLLLFLLPLTLPFLDLSKSAIFVCAAATFAAIQEGHLIRKGETGMTVQKVIEAIRPVEAAARAAALRRLNDMAKPLGSLGVLEEDLVRLAGIQGTPRVDISRRCVAVFCADNGVVAQGVTQCGQEVTAVVTENLSKGDTTVCAMARRAGCEVLPVDIGVAVPVTGERILQRCVRRGTADMTRQPAMTRSECEQALLVGVEVARLCKERGVGLLATGEMGIGNTTTSSAVAAVLLGAPAAEMTGRGAGLSTEGLARKIAAIETAIALHRPDPADPIDVVSKVGGLDIAGLAGLCLGGALCRIPVLLDGFISSAAALAAVRLCPLCGDYLLASHVSAEPAGQRLLAALGLHPLIQAGMRLGEGTGAVAAMPLLDLMLAAYEEMVAFDDIGVEPYRPLT